MFWNLGENWQEEDIWRQIVIRSYMLSDYVLFKIDAKGLMYKIITYL